MIFVAERQLFERDPLYLAPPLTDTFWKTLAHLDDQTVAEIHFTDLYMNLTREEILDAAHQPQDFIVDCWFDFSPNKGPCPQLKNRTYWREAGVTTFSPEYGVCYTFEAASAMSVSGAGRSDLPDSGVKHGLSLTFNLEGESFYLWLMTYGFAH